MFAHVDADAFFASVLQRQHPRLKGKPLLALGMGGGCVIAASYEAKAKGVKTGMRLKDALLLCPEAIRQPSDFRETGLASQQIEKILQDHCPRIEQMSIDEWYLDLPSCVGGIPNDVAGWATGLQKMILRNTALSVSVGAAPTKLLAKMAGEERKPAGITVLRLGDIEAFLRRRPAAAIPGIGRQRMVHAQANTWETAWDIATADAAAIIRLFGRPGRDLQRELLGEALEGVVTDPAPPKSVSRARSFHSLRDRDLLWAHLLQHLQYVTLKMRRHDLACRGLSVWLRDDRYAHASQHASLPQIADTEECLVPYVRRCFNALFSTGRAYTQVGLALWRLEPHGAVQTSLFEDPQDIGKQDALQQTLDGIREKFGRKSIHRGAALPVGTGTKKDMEMSVYE